MQAKKRYAILILFFFLGGALRLFFAILTDLFEENSAAVETFSTHKSADGNENKLESFLKFEDLLNFVKNFAIKDVEEPTAFAIVAKNVNLYKSCTMQECFNFSRCESSFKIYIYPGFNNGNFDVEALSVESGKLSEGYRKILLSLKKGNFYTDNPDEACLFVLSFDTLDRDLLSGDYVKNMRSKFNSLPEDLWNGGLNHLIFNLYPGTWPNYDPMDLGFDAGKAIIAKASFSVDHFRRYFDVSLPLFHKTHPLSGRNSQRFNRFDAGVPQQRSYLLVFKGKRYVHGIGSETRNSLYHLHNGRDVIMLTTCRHGKNWKQVKDERCDADNAIYDKWDYEELILNSSFCLIPRGRRLGSFRFLEAMEAGCIPVILSNGWELPFSEVIDWKSAVVWADENLLFQLPSVLRSIPLDIVIQMRQQAKHLSRLYFSTVEQIVFTTLEIIKQRLKPWAAPDLWMWNRWTGGVKTFLPDYSDMVASYPRPFFQRLSNQKFTAIITISEFIPLDLSSVWKLVSRLLKSKYAENIFVVFPANVALPNVPLGIQSTQRVKLLSFDEPHSDFDSLDLKVETEAIFMINSQIMLNTDEMDFAFDVWRWFQHRLVGYYALNHFYDSDSNKWRLTSSLSNCYSVISDLALLSHRYYFHAYKSFTKNDLPNGEINDNCFDVRLNMLATDLTGEPPIKLASNVPNPSLYNYFSAKRQCFDKISSHLAAEIDGDGDLTLEKSCTRFEPVLYKDTVSNLRKKYRQMEINRG